MPPCAEFPEIFWLIVTQVGWLETIRRGMDGCGRRLLSVQALLPRLKGFRFARAESLD
jgi:hypothetical protein